MDDGTQFANGWGQPASRRVQAVLDQNPGTAPAEAGGSSEATKSMWLNMQVSGGVFSLLKESYVVESPPSNLPVDGAFAVKVFSNGDAVLKHFGMHDPRIVQGEPGYVGPTWRDTANFQLVVPYFKSVEKVDLIESATGDVKLSVDLSKYATALAPVALCKNLEVALDASGQATISAADVDDGSYARADGSVTLSIDKSQFTCADIGQNSVILTATDEEGSPGACTAIVTVKDTTPPVIESSSATPNMLWPPNHKMTKITVGATATDNCTPSPVCAISNVSSDEPVNGLGDGDMAPDWLITGAMTLNLRAERSGKGDGRVYTITLTCADGRGNSSNGTTSVAVPLNQ